MESERITADWWSNCARRQLHYSGRSSSEWRVTEGTIDGQNRPPGSRVPPVGH